MREREPARAKHPKQTTHRWVEQTVRHVADSLFDMSGAMLRIDTQVQTMRSEVLAMQRKLDEIDRKHTALLELMAKMYSSPKG